MKNTLILVRHGESLGNVDKETYVRMPDHKVPLTNRGINQAEDVGIYLRKILEISPLKIDKVNIYFSPYERAKNTFKESFKVFGSIFDIPPSLIEEPMIREQEYIQDPEAVKYVSDEIEKMKRKDKFYHRFTGGESFADVDQRIFSFLNFLRAKDVEHSIMFSHNNLIEAMVRRILQIPIEEFKNLSGPQNCEIIVIKNLSEIDTELTTAKNLLKSLEDINRRVK